eukprot:6215725-Alexandrium_andersonii.AAC.1
MQQRSVICAENGGSLRLALAIVAVIRASGKALQTCGCYCYAGVAAHVCILAPRISKFLHDM